MTIDTFRINNNLFVPKKGKPHQPGSFLATGTGRIEIDKTAFDRGSSTIITVFATLIESTQFHFSTALSLHCLSAIRHKWLVYRSEFKRDTWYPVHRP
jgi:hypothetical protein